MVATPIRRLVGVYHADGGILGELRYVVGKVTGRAHCALCDLTHAGVRRRPSWDEMAAGLGVPVELVHLNERSPEVAAASEGRTPCVLAETDDGWRLLLGPAQLELGGDVERFEATVRAALAATG